MSKKKISNATCRRPQVQTCKLGQNCGCRECTSRKYGRIRKWNCSILLCSKYISKLLIKIKKTCFTKKIMSIAIIQLYLSKKSAQWEKTSAGVICLIKDMTRRSYFFRVYDLNVGLKLNVLTVKRLTNEWLITVVLEIIKLFWSYFKRFLFFEEFSRTRVIHGNYWPIWPY